MFVNFFRHRTAYQVLISSPARGRRLSWPVHVHNRLRTSLKLLTSWVRMGINSAGVDGWRWAQICISVPDSVAASTSLRYSIHFQRLFSRWTWVSWYQNVSILFFLLKLRVMELVVTTGAVRRATLHAKCLHQQTNIQFSAGQYTFLSPNQQRQSTEGKRLCHCTAINKKAFSSTSTDQDRDQCHQL